MSGLQNIACLLYMDDIVVYGQGLEEHNKRLSQVFDRLFEYNLKLQPEKCIQIGKNQFNFSLAVLHFNTSNFCVLF